MLQSDERETEILLGNKQLIAVFFVVAALLGVSFVGGYKVGQASGKKAPSMAPVATSPAAANSTEQGGETHSVSPEDASPSKTEVVPPASGHKGSEMPLGARKKELARPEGTGATPKSDGFVPQGGQEFLQVAAVPRDHAFAVAAVLRRKGFHAHAVPKPGGANLYRVIVGPIHDAGELSSTRDSLRKTGFNQVIVQRYQQ